MGSNATDNAPGGLVTVLRRRIFSIFGVYMGLPKPLYTLFIATVVNSVGIFVFPFMTLYLTGRLGMSQSAAGNFMFIISIIYIPGNYIGGKIADKFGRKKLMVIAQLISAALYIPCGFAVFSKYVPWLILASVLFDGITDPARTAMMTDLTTPENRRTAFSLTYLGHNLGFAVGSLIAGFLFEHASSWLFWGNALAVFAATAIVSAKVPETKPTQEQIDATIGSGSTEEAHRGTLMQALMSRPLPDRLHDDHDLVRLRVRAAPLRPAPADQGLLRRLGRGDLRHLHDPERGPCHLLSRPRRWRSPKNGSRSTR